MDVLEAIYRRRAVRDYQPDRPDEKTLHALIEAAIQAPTAMHREPWRFTIVRDGALLKRCSDAAKQHVLDSMSADSPLQRLRAELASPAFNIFYNAPCLILISSSAAEPMAEQDCCLAAENLMLAACARGLGSCWIGFAEIWLRTTAGKQALSLPPDHIPVAPIIIGYPAVIPAPTGRRAPEMTWLG